MCGVGYGIHEVQEIGIIMDDTIRVLYVDDDILLPDLVKKFLERLGDFSVTPIPGAPEAIALLSHQSFDVIISDYQMSQMDGISFLKHLKAVGDTTPFIFFTGRGQEEVVIEALNNGADFYLRKGGDPTAQFPELSRMARSAAQRRQDDIQIRRKNEELQEAYEQISAHEEELRANLDELTRQEQLIRRSEEQFRSLYTNMIDGAVLHNLIFDDQGSPYDYIIVETNPAFEKQLGIRREFVIGKTSREAYGVADPPYLDIYARVAITGEPKVFETYFPPLDKYFAISAYCLSPGSFATIFEDITERTRAEEQVHASQSLLYTTLDSIPDIIGIQKPDHSIIRYNKAGYAFFQASPEEIDGRRCYELLGRDRICENCATERALISKNPESFEKYIPEFNIFLDCRSFPILNAAGEVTLIIEQLRDITKEKEAEQTLLSTIGQLQEASGRYQALIAASNTGAWEYRADSGDLWFSPEYFFILGYGWDSFEKPGAGKSMQVWIDLLHPDDREDALRQFRSYVLNPEGMYEQQFRLRHRDGSWVWTLSRGQTLRDKDGRPTTLTVGTHIDITSQIVIEEKLRESNAFLENLINGANVPIIVWNPSFHITRVNCAFEMLIGKRTDEIIGKDLRTLFPPDQAERLMRLLQTTLEGVRWETVEIDVMHRDGSTRTVLWNSSTLYNPDGTVPVATFAQGRDITGEQRLEQEKDAAMAELQKNLTQLSLLNDQIRNPLTVVNLCMNRITDTWVIDQITDQVRRIDSIVNMFDRRWVESERVLNKVRTRHQVYSDRSGGQECHDRAVSGPPQDPDEEFSRYGKQDDILIEEVQAQLYTILDSIDALVYVADMDTHALLFVNKKGRHLYGDVLGQKCHLILYQNHDGPCPFCTNHLLMDQSGPVGVYRWEFQDPLNGRWFDCRDRAIRWSDGRLVRLEIATDITSRKQAEEKLHHVTRLYAMLSRIDQAIVRTKDQPELFSAICQIAIETGRFCLAWIGRADDISGRIFPVAHAGNEDGYLDRICVLSRNQSLGDGPTSQALLTREIVISSDIATDPRMAPWRDEALVRGYRSSAAVPLQSRGKSVGVFSLYAPEPDFFTGDELELLKRVGEDISFALDAMATESEHWQALNALKESEEKYRTLTDRVHDGIYIYQGNSFVFVNDRVSEISGYSKDELHSMNLWDLVDPADQGRVKEIAMGRQAGDPVPHTYEVRIITKDGGAKYLQLAVSDIIYNGTFAALGAARDITDVKRTENSLKESEERYRLLIEHLPDYILVHRNGEILYVNTAAADSFGYSQEELIGTHMMTYLTPESRVIVGEMMQKRFAGDSPPSYEITIIDKGGGQKIAQVHGVLIQYDGGLASLNVLTDITEQKAAEAALRESKGRLHTLVQTIPDLIWLKDKDGVYLSCNTQFERLFGAKESDIVGKTDYDFVDKDLADFFREHDKKAIMIGGPSINEEWVTFADNGERALLETIKTPMYDAGCVLIGVLGIGRDITLRKQAEQSLAVAQERLKEAHQLAHIGTWDWIRETDTVTWSEELYHLAGMDPSLPVPGYADHPRIYTPHSWDRLNKAVTESLTTGEPFNLELELVRPDGTPVWIHEFGSVKYDPDGNIIGLYGTVQNINERKKAEQALIESNKKLRLLTGLTRHDIFNQISSVQLLQSLALKSTDLDQVRTYISRSQEAGDLIEATIGFTREYENFGVASSGWQWIHPMIESAMAEVSLRDVLVQNQIPRDLEVYADPIIRKVFTTLMENAIRHGGPVTGILISWYESGDCLIITCNNDGVGIPDEEKDLIFEHGYGKNTGIGLFLAREILSITGLSIRECGVFGKGAIFEIMVPAGKWRIAGTRL